MCTKLANSCWVANGAYNYASATSSKACNNGIFGDPTPGTVKACFYSLTANGPAGPSGYIFCGNENQTCSFAGGGQVAFGANGSFYSNSFSSGASCSNATFGDPTPGTVKSCFYSPTGASIHFE